MAKAVKASGDSEGAQEGRPADAGASAVKPRKTPRRRGPAFVIAGDWVVDENWFLVRHHSDTSKHTGDAHYRRLEGYDQSIQSKGGSARPRPEAYDKMLDLCGAGSIARVLFNERAKVADYELIAIGRWQKKDQVYLTHLLHSGDPATQCSAGRLAYRLIQPNPPCKKPPEGIQLKTIDPNGPTIRAVRLYQRLSDGWHIVKRVDWEPPPSGRTGRQRPVSIAPDPKATVVVLDDLEKDTVDEAFVAVLRDAYPNAKWYVRAKHWPEWLKDINVELFVIGPELATQSSPFERWHEDGTITQEAMKALEMVKANNVVLLSERREVIGRLKDAEGADEVVWGRSHKPVTPISQVGWADAFMAGLIHQMAANSSTSVTPHERVRGALEVADRHFGVHGVPNPTQQAPSDPEARASGGWKYHQDLWKGARSHLGLIKSDRALELHVWRGSSLLKDYIACIPEKLDIIEEVGRHLRAFARGLNPRSLGILIQADPGTGKTHLARCLANAFDFELLSCDISQMVKREEIFDFFDVIATTQARLAGRRVLAFVDEINALVDGMPAYGAFLSPLESNVYSRRGHLFTLQPCVWLFTGTKIAAAGPETKESDFMSRMTLREFIDYESLAGPQPGGQGRAKDHQRDVDNAARLEQVYFGATMINMYFPDVTHVDQRLLEHFHSLPPSKAPFREIRQIVSSLRNVKHGLIHMGNLPDRDEERVSDSGLNTRVRIVFRPGETQSP